MQLITDYIGVVICFVLGLVMTIAMIVSCLCFGCARRLGGCGAKIKKKPLQAADNTKRIVLTMVVIVLVGLTT